MLPIIDGNNKTYLNCLQITNFKKYDTKLYCKKNNNNVSLLDLINMKK